MTHTLGNHTQAEIPSIHEMGVQVKHHYAERALRRKQQHQEWTTTVFQPIQKAIRSAVESQVRESALNSRVHPLPPPT